MSSYIVNKPWGHEEIWAHTTDYVGKILFVRKGFRLSLQHHKQKKESMRIYKGEVILSLEDDKGKMQEYHLCAGESIDILNGRKHRLFAVMDSEIIEVSTPEIDDIIRHEDDYGRL